MQVNCAVAVACMAVRLAGKMSWIVLKNENAKTTNTAQMLELTQGLAATLLNQPRPHPHQVRQNRNQEGNLPLDAERVHPRSKPQEAAANVTETCSIVLIGFMGTGKSAVGRALARRTGFRHLDTDAEIERTAGKTIPQIFVEEGEAAFREQETAVLASLAQAQSTDSLILSTGGGTPLREENAALLKQIGTVVWLHVAPEAILGRVAHSLHERPLLAAHQENPLERIKALLAQREPQYAALADMILETSDCANSEEGAMRLMERLDLA